ncbi:dihydrofolate reductase family protein [Actinophytocola sp.]|uniref:dihydrofolate reductase family protein n=1 Tax=Actinophytocola sp. TaxID=1872138 RepID=UPI002D7EE1CA|nr:dihydrofolate reductase family protein [Actinophytocola sp.]HET9141554.1 dihydrofolate reductase family protein [Actinophytocola sp.]
MGRVINSTFVSLDGVINHMDKWHFDFVDDETNTIALEQLQASESLLMGRNTYEVYASAWPTRDGELADRLNSMRKYVASTTLQTAEWNNTTVLGSDLVETVARLRQQPGDILMHGYGPVARTLLAHGLLDEIFLWVHPHLAGVGGPDDMIWADGVNQRLRLLNTRTLGSGLVTLSYAPADVS